MNVALYRQSKPFAAAAYHSATTLALVRPDQVVPAIFAQIEDDLLPAHLDFIGAEEFGIWGTPEGTAFVDGQSNLFISQGTRI